MRAIALFFSFAVLSLTSCASLEEGGGRIGPDYAEDDPTFQSIQTQRMHKDVLNRIW